MIVLLNDGSLRIYSAIQENVQFCEKLTDSRLRYITVLAIIDFHFYVYRRNNFTAIIKSIMFELHLTGPTNSDPM